MPRIYFDHNATAPVEGTVINAVAEVMANPYNASSIHGTGRQARSLIENARKEVAAFAGADLDNYRLVFTSSGTESNNLALKGVNTDNIIISAIEHASIIKTVKNANMVPVDSDGVVNIEGLERLLRALGGKNLVSIMLANNETGVIQPIKEIAAIVHKYGSILHTDAAQCFGKIEVDMKNLDVDLLTISAHKFGGPQGAAALITKKSVNLSPLITGGGQEHGYRAGSENIAAIHGFGTAAKIAREKLSSMPEISNLRDKLELELEKFAPNAVIFGKNSARLPNTSYIAMPGIGNQTQLIHFDLNGVDLSAGSACSSGRIEPSHVLKAMGVASDIAGCAIRISLGTANTEDEINLFIDLWKGLQGQRMAA